MNVLSKCAALPAAVVLLANAGSARATTVDAATASLVEADDIEVTEGTGANSLAVFTVKLRYDSTAPQTVDYQILPGTATAGLDYVAIPDGTLVFGPGETTKTIEVPIVGDAIPECPEGFTLRLQHWFHGAPMDVHCLIVDDDGYDGGLADCPPAFPGVDAGAPAGADGAAPVTSDGATVAEPDASVADAAPPGPVEPTGTPSPGNRADASPPMPDDTPQGSSGCSINPTGFHPAWLIWALALLLRPRRRR